MPTDAAQQESDRDRDMEEDTDEVDRNERGGSKQKSSSSSKTKDLSHVPCKFFKVGGCTAGASCPFSHIILEPGQQKEVCVWFVKGNCKFGHKCALAHILPGQSMAMDRKNKKAAQTAASFSEKGKSGKGGKKDIVETVGNKISLLSGGSTAPTRIPNSSSSGSSKPARAPINMPLKATISPSAPAPALKDADFASFATLDGLEGLQQNPFAPQDVDKTILGDSTKESDTLGELSKQSQDSDVSAEPIPLPPSAPRPSAISIVNDFGPIGSPPNFRAGQATSPNTANGISFSPAISPRNHSNSNNNHHGTTFLSNAPLSAPGTQEHFVSSSFSMRGGIAASLGSGIAMLGGRRGLEDHGPGVPNSFSGLLGSHLSSSTSNNYGLNGPGNVRGEYDINIEIDQLSGATRKATQGMDSAVGVEELGDFLPSSLNDLLTPEEKSRRTLRSSSQRPSGFSHLSSALANVGPDLTVPADTNGFRDGTATAGNGNGNLALGHRHSRSVPASNLLGEIKSIWTDTTTNPIPASPHHGPPAGAFASVIGRSSRADEIGHSMSIGSAGATPSSLGMIGPSNASAAFLPSLHKHYVDAKTKQVQQSQLGLNRGPRGASSPLLSNSLANNYTHPIGGAGSVSNPSGLHAHMHGSAYWASPSPFDLTKAHQSQPQAARHIPPNPSTQVSKLDDPLTAPTLLSPSSRALQSHAPGQSLPQGLAAGYSRIHALPPLTNITSPPSGSFVAGFSPAGKAFPSNTEGPLGEWLPATSTNQGMSGSVQSNSGMDSVISRFPYSAAAARNTNGGPPAGHSCAPPGLSRNTSGGRYIQSLSPLNGPIMTRDDDILFEMDK